MTNQDKIDEILEGYITDYYGVNSYKAKTDAKQAIQALITEARIDEIEGWFKGVAGRYPLLADAIPRRIKELQGDEEL